MQNKSHYPENWADQIRPSILKRDGYKCMYCRVRHRSYIVILSKNSWKYIDKDEVQDYLTDGFKSYKIYLQVAHKDCNKQNNNPDNLITLCQRCHHDIDKQWKILVRIGKLVKP